MNYICRIEFDLFTLVLGTLYQDTDYIYNSVFYDSKESSFSFLWICSIYAVLRWRRDCILNIKNLMHIQHLQSVSQQGICLSNCKGEIYATEGSILNPLAGKYSKHVRKKRKGAKASAPPVWFKLSSGPLWLAKYRKWQGGLATKWNLQCMLWRPKIPVGRVVLQRLSYQFW